MKQQSFLGSILPNTNKIISESHADWSGIREGALIRFKGDVVLYYAAKIEQMLYVKDFFIEEGGFFIKDNTSVFLSPGDTVSISYKEFTLLTVNQIVSGGAGYQTGDTIFVEGGEPCINLEDNYKNVTHLTVTEISAGGSITNVSINDSGKYIVAPQKEAVVTGGNGKGAVLNLEYVVSDNRAITERDIVSIQQGGKTKINISYPLPKGVYEGKISSPKNILYLSSQYVGKMKHSCEFEVSRDFTTNYSWPRITSGSESLEFFYNLTLTKQDQKIFELESKIKELEFKLSSLAL